MRNWFQKNRAAKLEELAVTFRSIAIAFFVGSFLAELSLAGRIAMLGASVGWLVMGLSMIHAKQERQLDPRR